MNSKNFLENKKFSRKLEMEIPKNVFEKNFHERKLRKKKTLKVYLKKFSKIKKRPQILASKKAPKKKYLKKNSETIEHSKFRKGDSKKNVFQKNSKLKMSTKTSFKNFKKYH